jgi:hypothetical protein
MKKQWKCSDKLEKLKAFVLKEQFAKYAANKKDVQEGVSIPQ